MHLSHPKTIHPGARVLGAAGLERMKQLEVRACLRDSCSRTLYGDPASERSRHSSFVLRTV